MEWRTDNLFDFIVVKDGSLDDNMLFEDYESQNEGDANKTKQTRESMLLNDFKFLKIIESVGKCLLEKCQKPAMKKKKRDALRLVISECLSKHGIQLTEQQARRKLENLKMRLKAKSDAKKTGNKPIALNSADLLLLTLLNANENPSITQIPLPENSTQKPSLLDSTSVASGSSISLRSTASLVTPKLRDSPAYSQWKGPNSGSFASKKSEHFTEKEKKDSFPNKNDLQREVFRRQMQIFDKQEELINTQIQFYKAMLEKLTSSK